MTNKSRTARTLIVVAAATLMLLAMPALAQDSETVLYTFTGGRDGAIGGGNLVADSAGNLYGTTFDGGNKSTKCGVYTDVPGCGVVFKLTPTAHGPWKETVLYTFTGGADGAVPTGGVILDSAGNLYGTTLFGGDKKPEVCHAVSIYAAGCGVVFKLTPTAHGPWAETVLYTFTGGADGSEPASQLIFDSTGNLYGTTTIGGNNDDCGPPPYGCGVVFKLTPSAGGPWTESVLYSFSGGTDGGFASGGLTFDSQGNLYGTTFLGGDTSVSCDGVPGCGVVFQLTPTPSGPWTETVLHAFTAGSDGGFSSSSVTLDSGGNVYGTTIVGGDTTACSGTYYGASQGCGVVFELAHGTWEETVLYAFTPGSDGEFDHTSVIFDSSGNLYGMTSDGGDFKLPCTSSFGCGVVFKLTPTGQGPWTESVLYAFTGGTDGNVPASNLLLDSAGNIFGITEAGGNTSECTGNEQGGSGCGVVFELTPILSTQ
jgi:uncharacterized repeat protein (TIGR03803 family)